MGPRRSSAPKHQPNHRLAWARLQRGWGQRELVEQIRRSMASAGEPEPGLTEEAVRRWEAGDRKPEPRYKKHLVLVFGESAEDLGLLSSEELAISPVPVPPAGATVDARMIEAVVRQVMAVLLGDDGRFGRDLFLKGLLGTSLSALLPLDEGVAAAAESLARPQRTRLDERSVDAYAAITTSQQALYWSTPPTALLDAATAHARLGAVLLRGAFDTDPLFTRLAGAVAQSALLAARLCFFDLSREKASEQFFQLAQDAVSQSRDHHLSAVVLAHRAFVPGFAGREQQARNFLKAAHAHIRQGAGPLTRAWLHCVDAEISARVGRQDASIGKIGAAEDALSREGTDPLWLDFFDASRLSGFAGNALLLAGDHAGAATRLREALDGLAEDATKQRTVLLLDLAAAQAPGDADEAFGTARQACALLEHDRYAAAVQRLPQVHTALSGTPYAKQFGEEVRSLTGGA